MSYLLVSFFATNHKAIALLESQWKNRDPRHQKYHGRKSNQSSRISDKDLGGKILLLKLPDFSVVWEKYITSPFGICFNEANQQIISTSSNSIKLVSNNKIIKQYTNRLFNDLHSIAMLSSGQLITTSTGTDSIIILDKSDYSKVDWAWLATENGYDVTPSGQHRKISKQLNYNKIITSTTEHTTHVNSAIVNNDMIIATLFHQGYLIGIDIQTGQSKILIKGLACPHSIRKTSSGYTLCDTLNARVLLLDQHFNIDQEINYNFDWVQDAILLSTHELLVADSNNSRIVMFDLMTKAVKNEFRWGNDKIASMCLLPKRIRWI